MDLFSGAGGFSLGFEKAGFESVGGIDIHPDPLTTYLENRRTNNPNLKVLKANIQNLSKKRIFKELNLDKDKSLDVIIGGPPCQGFSLRGNRKRTDPRNDLINDFICLVAKIQPEIFVIENVPGLASNEGNDYLNKIVEKIQNLSYNLGIDLLYAPDYGVPQNRTRLFIIASRTNRRIYFPQKRNATNEPFLDEINQKNCLLERLEHQFLKNSEYITTKEALSDIAIEKVQTEECPYKRQPISNYQKIMRENCEWIYNHRTTRHRPESIEQFKYLKPGGSIKDIPINIRNKRFTLMRMHPEKISGTLTSCNEDFLHYKLNRIITIREMARLQSYPDSYIFHGTRTTGGDTRRHACCQVQQVANSVPPLLAEVVGNAVMKTLCIEPANLTKFNEKMLLLKEKSVTLTPKSAKKQRNRLLKEYPLLQSGL